MALLLAISLLDEVTDLVAKLRAAPVAERYPIENELAQKATKKHAAVLLKEIDAGPADIRPHLIRVLRPIDAKAELQGLLGRYEYSARAEAAYMLKLLGDDAGLRMLLAELPKVAAAADKQAILFKLYSYYLSGPDVVAALKKFLETEKDENLRRIALNTLTSHKDDSILPLLRALAANDPLRPEALAALIRLGDAAALEQAMKDLEAGKASPVVISAIQMLGDRSVLPRLREALEKTEDVNTKIQIIQALSWMMDTKALGILSRLAEDKNISVANAAADALMKLAGRSNLDLIKKLAKSEDMNRRLSAAEALLQLDDSSGYDVLRDVTKDKTSAWRLRAVQIAGAVRRPESIDLLLDALADPEAQVATQARQALLASLQAMYPYAAFDPAATPDALRKWWSENRR